MSTAPNTGSTTSREGTNKTSTAISTNIIIMVGNAAVGAVQQLQISETRSIRMVDEVGTDGHVDSVPHASTIISGSCERVRFDGLRVAEAFSRGFVHVASQIYPFDIVIIDKQKQQSAKQISTVIKNVWIKSISYTYSASDWIITDRMEWEAETIFSILNGGSADSKASGRPVAHGGERGINFATFNAGDGGNLVGIEQLTDTGANGRRGSLDAAGLIDIGDSGGIF